MEPELPSVFRVDATGGAGLTYEQTRSAGFVTPPRGVRVTSDAPPGADVVARTASTGCVDGAVVTGLTAARLWRMPLPPWTNNRDVAVAVRPGEAHPRRRGVRGRRLRLPDGHVTGISGVLVTTPARTWLDCAAEVPDEYVIAMGDDVLRRNLTSTDELRSLLHWGYRRRGVAVARRAFPLLDAASASPGESLIRAHLLREGIPRPECNIDIVVAGEWLARGDLGWREYRIVLEYDGLVHLDERQRRHDAQRRNLLQQRGWIVITATAADLRQPWILAGQVLAALRSRGWRP